MTWWEAIVLGVVQGLTEFLPISSSAHLRIVGDLLPGGGDPGAAFTAITQLGTETAVLVYFRKDIWRILRSWFGALPVGPWRGTVPKDDPDARMGWYIIIGSVPIVVFGLLFQDAIETSLRHLYITATMLAVFAIILGVADRLGRKRKQLEELTLRDGLLFGLAQSLALVPGVSRSGGTITMGLLLGYTREAAARYSFLLAIPAVFGSGFYQLFRADIGAPGTPGAAATTIATIAAFGVGFLVIIAFLKIVSTYSYMPFVVYRLVLAGFVVVGVLSGLLDPVGAAAPTTGP